MPLPKIEHPLKTIKIPSTGKEIQIRPMTVKEEKISLMANESNDMADKIAAISQIIQNCIVTKDFDTMNCPSFDAEYIYMHIMGFSVQNIYEMKYTDQNKKEINFAVNLDDVVVIFPEKSQETNIKLSQNVGVKMRYLTFKDIEEISKKKFDTEYEESLETTKRSIECIYDEENVYDEYTEEELQTFINDLNSESFGKIINFFEKMPYLYYETNIKDSNEKQVKIKLKGLNDFFSY